MTRPLSKFHLSVKTNLFCPIFVSSSQRLMQVISTSLLESTFVDPKNLSRKSLVFPDKANFERGLLYKIFFLCFLSSVYASALESPKNFDIFADHLDS